MGTLGSRLNAGSEPSRTSLAGLVAVLQTRLLPFPISGISAEHERQTLNEAEIDGLLSQHPADVVLEELETLERQVDAWSAAIGALRSVISAHPMAEGSSYRAHEHHTHRSSQCEADDEYWYL